ncbi:MAG: long-chain fatty acid--CoA ligase [Armatimonadota bacterium]|nr:long-chain fatty acid--CoA ligase [Armatimonadota bacterium]MDR7429612.1 long-chain fatty acid--CoA ligase [Armatimonadota bacterium]MDR7446665.1 long-chain fatty acid--CoA ligase [Armatimonadota bacterium]MDR7462851.1 long-chain fatty acid--CoA ligase [Armatimonadota bacterium]MDR7477752.1 long-chain fatty acid--CoA ligase [Armatimonadota bacterium]
MGNPGQPVSMDFPLTTPRILDRARVYHADVGVVCRRPDRSLVRTTYGEVVRRARALASALRNLGVRPQDRVATLCWNHREHLECYLGVPASGAVLHTLNLRLHPEELAYIVEHAQDRVLVVDDVLLPLFETFRERVRVERIFVVPTSGKPVPPGYDSYEELVGSGDPDFAPPELSETSPAMMCYTSGTTGRPKGVAYSHRALVLAALATLVADSFAISCADTVLATVPMFHVAGWVLPFSAPLAGARLVLPGPHLDPRSLAELLSAERATFSAGVPTVWLGVVQLLEREPGRWPLAPGLRVALGGSAPPEALLRAMRRLGIRPVHGWGMTEVLVGIQSHLRPWMEGWPEERQYEALTKQGTPVPLLEARVVSEVGEVAPDGRTPGELQVRGPWVAAGYHRGEAPDSWTPDGWFRTGDVAVVDPAGQIRIVDRTKDLIKSGGEWISSVDLENALMAHPKVQEAAVVAVPHPQWMERPLAVVVPRPGQTPTPEELRAFLGQRFPKWWLPDAFVFATEIPKTSTGKLAKAVLRERYRTWSWS